MSLWRMLKGFPLVKVITMAYDMSGNFPSHPISLISAIRTPPFATLLELSWPLCCSSDTPSKSPPRSLCLWCSLCLEQSLPDIQNFFFSGLFLNVIFKQRPALNTLYKKSNAPFGPAWAPYPASFPFMTLTISTLGFFWFVCNHPSPLIKTGRFVEAEAVPVQLSASPPPLPSMWQALNRQLLSEQRDGYG